MTGLGARQQGRVQEVQTELGLTVMEAFSSGVKRPKCEVDCLPSSGTEAKNSWSCTSAHALAYLAALHN